MSAPATRGAFTHKLPRAVTFRAWKLGTTDQAHPVEIEADTLDDALAAALADGCLNHKDRLFILHSDEGRGRAWLHCWSIKRKSTPRYVRGPDMTSRPVYDLYAADPFVMAVDAFAPTRPFDALRDDPCGVDLTLVEG